MALTDREKRALQEIYEWESKLLTFVPNDFQLTFEKYLESSFHIVPENLQRQFFSIMDSGLFHMNALIQGSEFQMEARERIVSLGRLADPSIENISDLKRLNIDALSHIAEQQMARHRFYALIQGGLVGSGSPLFLGTDLLAMSVINLRAVQLIAFSYGIEINTPFELMTSLKVFHAALLPPKFQKAEWKILMEEREPENRFFYEGNECLTDILSMEYIIKQLLKVIMIFVVRKKTKKGLPFVSSVIGSSMNYQLTKKVTEFANKYYQLRLLLEKEVHK